MRVKGRPEPLAVGASRAGALIGPAELRNHFDGRWSGGFRVVAALRGPNGLCYRVVRCSDGTTLPVGISPTDIRRGDDDSA